MPAPSRGVLLGEIDHREPADPSCAARFDVIEVHSARDHLVIAVANVPVFAAAKRAGVMLEHRHQHAARRVDPDDRLRRQIHELDHLRVRGLLERIGHVVRIRHRVNLAQIRFGGRHDLIDHIEPDVQYNAGGR